MTDERAESREPEGNDDQFAVRVKVTPGRADELLRRDGLDFGDHPNITANPDGTGSLDLFVSRTEIAALQAEGFQLEIGANLSARARERRAEVGQGDRYEGGRIAPRGIGRKIGGRTSRRPSDTREGDGQPGRPS